MPNDAGQSFEVRRIDDRSGYMGPTYYVATYRDRFGDFHATSAQSEVHAAIKLGITLADRNILSFPDVENVPLDERPEPDSGYAIMRIGIKGASDRLVGRDTYDAYDQAAADASAMMAQDCGEGGGYYVVELKPAYSDPKPAAPEADQT